MKLKIKIIVSVFLAIISFVLGLSGILSVKVSVILSLLLIRGPLSWCFNKNTNYGNIQFIVSFVPFVILIFLDIANYDLIKAFSHFPTYHILYIFPLAVLFSGLLHRDHFNLSFLKLLGPIDSKTFSFWIPSIFLGTIFEEYFFRYIIIGEIGYVSGLIVSTILFVTLHYLSDLSNTWFSVKDYFSQTVLSILTSISLILSKSIWAAIIVHFIFNSPLLFSYVYRFTIRNSKKAEMGRNI
jgi:membrane protease YdiL (CAAX protease family)